MVTSSARSSNVCKLHFLPHVIEYIIYRFVFCRWLLHCLTHDVPLFTNLHFCHGQQTVSIFYVFAARCWNFSEIYIFAATLVVALIVHLHYSFNIFCVFTFLPHDVEFFVKFTFLPLVVTLIVHLHFRRYTCCCSCIVCTSTFLPVVLHCLQI